MRAFDAYKILNEREAGSMIDLIAPCMDDYLYIIDLKNEYSKKFFGKDKEPYSLYQILTTQITYSVICEIAFLILCIFEKCIINYLPGLILKAICSANIALFMYILFVLLIIIKNIYFSFWRSK